MVIRRLYTTIKLGFIKLKKKKRTHIQSTWHLLLQSVLDESTEDGGQTHGGHVGNVDGGSALAGRGGSAAAAASAAGTGRTVLGGRVRLFGLAFVFATDGLVIRELFEGIAAEVAGALHVEAATDILQGRKFSPRG